MSVHTGSFSETFGKAGLAFNRFIGEHYEKKAVHLQKKVDESNVLVESLQEAKQELAADLEEMRRDGSPGAELIQLQSKVFDRKIEDALKKRDRVQSKMEAHVNRRDLFNARRDAIADKLIHEYEQKLSPMERRLKSMRTRGDEIARLADDAKAHLDQQEARLVVDKEQKLEQRQAKWRQAQFSDADIRDLSRPFERAIRENRDWIHEQRAKISKLQRSQEARIARAEQTANPWRDRRDAIARVKSKNPAEVKVPERTRVPVEESKPPRIEHRPRYEETVPAHTEPAGEQEPVAEGGPGDIPIQEHEPTETAPVPVESSDEEAPDSAHPEENETHEAGNESVSFDQSFSQWTAFLGLPNAGPARKNLQKFFADRGMKLGSSAQIKREDFKRMLRGHYRSLGGEQLKQAFEPVIEKFVNDLKEKP
ncbi:MAG TPA: hypothetical protein VF829_02835 [Candidatus Paceibacterota bacterium]